jgi:hypothetical protein
VWKHFIFYLAILEWEEAKPYPNVQELRISCTREDRQISHEGPTLFGKEMLWCYIGNNSEATSTLRVWW